MSVLVTGMEMPTGCFACPMCDEEVNCIISHGSYVEYRKVDPNVAIQGRPPWCPLIEVPKGAKVKIEWEEDADKPREKEFIHGGDTYAAVMSRDIRNAPTIIPTEESNMDSFIRIFEEDDEEDGMDSSIRILKD